MKLCAVLEWKYLATLTVVLTVISFQCVHSAPLRKPGSTSDQEENGKPNRKIRRDVGLVQDNDTAAGVIYYANKSEYMLVQTHVTPYTYICVYIIVSSGTELIHEFPDWLVEMDIVRSHTIEPFRQSAIDERPTGSETWTTTTEHREKKASFNTWFHGYLYWPGARVPYAFHPYIGIYVVVSS